VASEVFTLDRLEPVACYLASATGADGLTGTLTLSGQEDGILVAQLSPRSVLRGNTRSYVVAPRIARW